MHLTKRKLSYWLLPAAWLLHLSGLVLASSAGFAMFVAGAVVLIISIWLNLASPGGKREEFYWVPAIGCILFALFTLFMYIAGFAVIAVWTDFTG